MDFGFSEEQEMLRQSARSLLERECPSAHVRQMMDDDRGYSPELWRKMAGLGWLGLVTSRGAWRRRTQLRRPGGGGRGDGPRVAAVAIHLDADVCRGGEPRRFRRAEAPVPPRDRARRTDRHGRASGGERKLGGKRHHDGCAQKRRWLRARRRQIVRQRRACRRFFPGRGAHRRQARRRGDAVCDRREAPWYHGDAAQDDGSDAQTRRGHVPRRESFGRRRRGRSR